MRHRTVLQTILISTISAGALAATPALAQAATEGEAEAPIADIVVTAQKREERAQNVPIALTALGAAELKAAGVTDTAGLRAAVPALNVTTATGGYALPRIRGIGSTGQGPGIENPVAVYVDGVYYGAAFGVLQSLFDAQQVTVLKGPQGTLFGRNATGGLIQIATMGPSSKWTGKAEVGYGNFQTMNTAAYLSGPISDTLSFSLSGQFENRDKGFGKNLFTGGNINSGEGYALRGKLKWQAADTSVLLSADANGRNASEPAFRNFTLNTLGQNVTNQIIALGGNPERDIYADFDPYLRTRQKGGSVTIEQGLGGVSLKSITAYRDTKIRAYFDPDGTVQPQLRIDNYQYDRQFTQELNLLSEANGPLKWVVGGFYMWNSAGTEPGRTTGTRTFGGNGYTDNVNNVRLKSLSGFGEVTWSFDQDTHLIAGIRYTNDDRSLTAQTNSYNGATSTFTAGTPVSDSHTFKKTTWRLSLDHRFSPEVMLYASYNRGFRSGTYIAQAFTAGSAPLLNPEEVDAFEVGLKTDLFGRRVRLNVAGFYYDEKNIQVMQVISGVQNVYNARGAHIYGLDADLNWSVTKNLRLFGGLNLTHARYTSFTDAVLSIPYPVASTFNVTNLTYVNSKTGQTVANTACLGTFGSPLTQLGGNCLYYGDASGHKLQNTPELTFSLGGAFDVPTQAGLFTLSGNVYYNDGFVGSPDERVTQSKYTLVDASLTWHHPNEHMYAKVWGRNLTDAFYRTQIGASNSGDNGTYGAPRTYGATIGFEF
ncbi:TonB-dependent receptor [Novosphingobium flavum]|uniref:TonB-dependent receptor n=1 Tax=Novosphingobium flavum TaxID=1778672 RepID=A0A7X1FS66_9SPHN|nr:TonB-dependent receptor [Novosphingobium flavum]MBC2665986.1 TonB-dependent receptor [Novosphingobium flavum]